MGDHVRATMTNGTKTYSHEIYRLWIHRPETYGLWSVMAKEPISEAAGTFGARVRARRLELGKSQEQLAEDSDLHWSYLGQVERGTRNVTLHNILKIAEVLQIDPGELVRALKAPR